jgi:hypothetical protein
MPSTLIRGMPAGPQADGVTAFENEVESDRAALWDALGGRQGVIRGFVHSGVAGAMALDFTPGSGLVEERDASGNTGVTHRGYHVWSDVTARVTFDPASASARNDAVVLAFVDVEDGALGTGVSEVGGQLVVVTGVSGTTTPRTDADINAWVGKGGWVRLMDVPIASTDTEINVANIAKSLSSWTRNTGWVALTGFATGWSSRAGTYTPAYRLWADGRIDLRGGMVKSSAFAHGETVLTLPGGTRPATAVVVACGLSRGTGGAPAGRLAINADGTVVLGLDADHAGGENWISLDSIRYDLT